MSGTLRKHLISSVLIFLFGGTIEVTLQDPAYLNSQYFLSYNFFVSFFYSGASWFSFWKGSEFIVNLLDRLIPWIEAPIKRFFVSLVTLVVYMYLAVWLLDLFVDLVLLGKTLSSALERTGAPFWRVFFITLGMNVFMHGRGFLLSWRKASIDLERLKTEQISMQFESLKNQVNPHFLFNSLNALSSLVYDDQAKAVEFIRKLSQVYRYVLDKKDKEVVTLQEEMAFSESFIFLQKIRFGDNLAIQVNKLPEPCHYHVPPLAIQLLLENAIKHNVISEQYPLSIGIVFEDGYCEVSNGIKERLEKDSTGIGLNNLKSRYQFLTDKPVQILRNESTFTVKLPLLELKAS